VARPHWQRQLSGGWSSLPASAWLHRILQVFQDEKMLDEVASSAFMMTKGSASIVVVIIGSSMPSRLQHRCHHHHHYRHHGHGGSLFVVVLLHFVCVQIAVTVALITAATTMTEKHQENQGNKKASIQEGTVASSPSASSCIVREGSKKNDNKEIWLVKRLKLRRCVGFRFQNVQRGKKPHLQVVFAASLNSPMK